MLVVGGTAEERRRARQREEARKHLWVLYHRGELTEESIEAVIRTYDDIRHKPHAKRYLKRMLALFRAGVLTSQDVAHQRWDKVEERAKCCWYDEQGQLLPRELHRELAEVREMLRSKPKRERRLCIATRRDGQPCQAKAHYPGALCLRHEKMDASKVTIDWKDGAE